MNKNNIIVIPDVHGRPFWKEAKDYNCEIVFLGDYVDPYKHEGITKEMALENFKEIIEFAKSNSKVHLLYGNHDCEYSIGQDVCNCRCDYDNYDEIRNLFIENKDLFKFVHIVEKNGKKIVLSHAGFHPEWVRKHGITPEVINSHLEDNEKFDKLHIALCDVSYQRGGWNKVGSMIWSDIREYIDAEQTDEYEQIVGHTMMNGKSPLRIGNITCIDLQKPFMINDVGELTNIDGSQAKIIKI